MGYGLIMRSVQETQISFTIKSNPIFNTQIDEGIFEKEKILEIFQQQILELMEKSNKSRRKVERQKKNTARLFN